jgi:uroporphyrin-III C-methyltransferase
MPEPEWAALAKSGLTLVIYMGVARCEAICQALTEGGLAPSTPAAVVQSAWQPNERVHATTLGQLAPDLARLGFVSPAILVVGEVARHAETIRGSAFVQWRQPGQASCRPTQGRNAPTARPKLAR